jgi:hypothetical protein
MRSVRQFRWMIHDILREKVLYLIAEEQEIFRTITFRSDSVTWQIQLVTAKSADFSAPDRHHLMHYLHSSSRRQDLADILSYACTLDNPKAFLESPPSREEMVAIKQYAELMRPIVDVMTT